MRPACETGRDADVRVAVSGKGGAGKTTLAAGLARLWAERGERVVAVDADPDANLAAALGASPEEAARCAPLSHMDDLIEERVGARPGASGGMLRLTPDVSDIVERCGIVVHGVTLLRMGTVERGGAGCLCPESTFLQALLRHVLLRSGASVVLDMEAGIEHLGRGTARGVDLMVVVVEPTSRSVQTARLVRGLAEDFGVPATVAVGNKLRSSEDEEYVREALGDIPLVAGIPESEAVRDADREGVSPFDADPSFARSVADVSAALQAYPLMTTGGRPCW